MSDKHNANDVIRNKFALLLEEMEAARGVTVPSDSDGTNENWLSISNGFNKHWLAAGISAYSHSEAKYSSCCEKLTYCIKISPVCRVMIEVFSNGRIFTTPKLEGVEYVHSILGIQIHVVGTNKNEWIYNPLIGAPDGNPDAMFIFGQVYMVLSTALEKLKESNMLVTQAPCE